MKNKIFRFLLLTALIVLTLLPAQVFADDNIEVIVTRHAGVECRMTTFEGAVEYEPIGLIPELNTTFDSGWITLNYGYGEYWDNNPSPPTIALWIDNNDDITFEEPVAAVSFYYSSPTNFTLYALRESGDVIDWVLYPANDPLASYNIWEPVSFTFGTDNTGDNIISKLRVIGPSGVVAIDDFQTCRVYAPPAKDSPLRIDLINNHDVYYDNVAKAIVLDMSCKWNFAKAGKNANFRVHTTVQLMGHVGYDAESISKITILGEEADEEGYVKIEPIVIPYDLSSYKIATFTAELMNPGGKILGEPTQATGVILAGGSGF